MSIETTCGECGEEYDARHGNCPARIHAAYRAGLADGAERCAEIASAQAKKDKADSEGVLREMERMLSVRNLNLGNARAEVERECRRYSEEWAALANNYEGMARDFIALAARIRESKE